MRRERGELPSVRSTGPIPRMPSNEPSNPDVVFAAPMDWLLMTRPLPRSNLSVSTTIQ